VPIQPVRLTIAYGAVYRGLPVTLPLQPGDSAPRLKYPCGVRTGRVLCLATCYTTGQDLVVLECLEGDRPGHAYCCPLSFWQRNFEPEAL